MKIVTESNFLKIEENHPWAEHFTMLHYEDGAYSSIPKGFFRDWLDQDISQQEICTFQIGRGSGLGVGSIAKYDTPQQSLRVGRFVAGGLRLRFLLNGQHEMGTISTCMFSIFGQGFRNSPPPQYGDTILKNDIWIGDEAMFLGGSTIENGCVIGARTVVPPNFKSEPYGIYVGSPARLVRFRFPEKVREALLALAWWEMPMDWIKLYNEAFLVKLANIDESQALDLLALLQEAKQIAQHATPASD